MTVSPLRWPIAIIVTSWKRSLHFASLTTKKEDPTVWSLYGRRLFIVLHEALCPPLRATLWRRKRRARSVLKLVRPFHALADSWLQAIWRSAIELYHLLTHACATAERFVGKVSRKRRTTVHILHESLSQHHESAELAMAINA